MAKEVKGVKTKKHVTLKIKASTYHALRKQKNVSELIKERKVTFDELIMDMIARLPTYAVMIQEVEPNEKNKKSKASS